MPQRSKTNGSKKQSKKSRKVADLPAKPLKGKDAASVKGGAGVLPLVGSPGLVKGGAGVVLPVGLHGNDWEYRR
jgi:hypothetical protein